MRVPRLGAHAALHPRTHARHTDIDHYGDFQCGDFLRRINRFRFDRDDSASFGFRQARRLRLERHNRIRERSPHLFARRS